MSKQCQYYQVRVTTPGGLKTLPWLTEANSRHAYEAWCEGIGKTCMRIELWGRRIVDSAEIPAEVCDLRSDLWAGVGVKTKGKTVENVSEQMELFTLEVSA